MIIIAAQTPFNYIKLCGFSKIPFAVGARVCGCGYNEFILLNIVNFEIIYAMYAV